MGNKISLLLMRANSANAKSDTGSDSGNPVASSNEAIQVVRKLVGSGNNKYIFELDHEDKVIKDDNGNFYTNRNNTSGSNGIDCFINLRRKYHDWL